MSSRQFKVSVIVPMYNVERSCRNAWIVCSLRLSRISKSFS